MGAVGPQGTETQRQLLRKNAPKGGQIKQKSKLQTAGITHGVRGVALAEQNVRSSTYDGKDTKIKGQR